MGDDRRQGRHGMTIPEEAYLTGIWEVSVDDEYEAQDAVRSYYASRSVSLAKRAKQPVFRICFLVILVPLLCMYLSNINLEGLNKYMAFIALLYAPPALWLILWRKNLGIPAWGSLVFLAECFRFHDPTAIVGIVLPIVILGGLAYFHERDKRYIERQPGYPDFRYIDVRVIDREMPPEREVPPPSEPAEDPYKDILSDLQ